MVQKATTRSTQHRSDDAMHCTKYLCSCFWKKIDKSLSQEKLRAANVERQPIIQVTGHASEQWLQDYDEGNEEEQRVLSIIISNQQQFPKESIQAKLFNDDFKIQTCFQFKVHLRQHGSQVSQRM